MEADLHEIRFRPIERDDLDQLQEWRNRSDISLICREYRLLNMVMQEEWFDGLLGDRSRLTYGIIHPDQSGFLIGVCGWTFIDWRSRHALLSMYIGDENYMKDEWYLSVLRKLHEIAFNELGMETVRAEIYDFDPRKHIFPLAGYKQMGIRRNAYFHDGEFWNINLMDIIRSEWLENLK